MLEKNKKAPRHVPDNLIYNGRELSGEEANQIIEEIMVILTKQRITIMTAKQVLEDTIKALDRETILEGRLVDGEIIQADQLSREENGPDAQNLGGYASVDREVIQKWYV